MTCEQAGELISREIDAPLPRSSKLGLAVHLFFCSYCRRFRSQMAALDAAAQRLLREESGPESIPGLGDEARRRLQARLLEERNRD